MVRDDVPACECSFLFRSGTQAILRPMDRLWTPWRYEYVSRSRESSAPGVPEELNAWVNSPGAQVTDCVFCNMIRAVDYAVANGMTEVEAERAVHLLVRAEHCFLCLNAFPYGTGHILLVPYRHVPSLAELPSFEAEEMIRLAQQVERVLRQIYRPDGLNFGINLGEAGGAGIADHLHMHALPRWIGDTNFMTVTANTRVLPETPDTTWERIRGGWK